MELRKMLKYLCPYFLVLKLYGCATIGGAVEDTKANSESKDVGPVFTYAADATKLYDAIDNITVSPPRIHGLVMEAEQHINVNYTCNKPSSDQLMLQIRSDDKEIADITKNATSFIKCVTADSFVNSVTVRGNFIGKTKFKFTLYNVTSGAPKNAYDWIKDYSVTIARGDRRLTNIFVISIAVFSMVLSIGFGCGLDLGEVKTILKRPIPPAIGFACQFLLMPMLAFGVSHMLGMSKTLGIGLLVTSTCPGGGGSNVWTVMLGGDLNLSLTMTFISKIAALGTMPLWLFALGRFYTDSGTRFQIPYMNIFTGLLALVGPVFIGLLIRRFKPTIAAKIVRLLKPGGLIFVLYVIIFGTISNLYVYRIMARNWYVVPGIMLVTYSGYLFGFLAGLIFRQGKIRAVTIGVETGIQDTGIAVILLQGTFPIPEGDIAATIPMMTGLFTPWPLLITFIALTIYKKKFNGSWENEEVSQVKAGDDVKVGKELMAPDSPQVTPVNNQATNINSSEKNMANGSPVKVSPAPEPNRY